MHEGAVLTEADIRPDALMAGQEACFAQDIAALMARRDKFVRVTCPACGTDLATPRFTKFDMTFVACDVCGTIYANPRPAPVVLEHYYATSQNYAYFNTHIFPASEDARRDKIFRPRVARLRELMQRHQVPRHCLLEVGAGFGTFGQEVLADRLFERVIAVEPTPALAATCRQRGLDVIEAPVEKVSGLTSAPNVIVAFEVIEHLFCPRDFVQACAGLLSPGGLLVLTCPSGRGFDVEVLGSLSDTVDVEHLNLFSPASLALLLGDHGFEVLEITTPGRLDAELVRKKAMAGALDLSGNPFLQRVLLDEWDTLGPPFQTFLAEHGLSSHQWAVARKQTVAGRTTPA
jgi:SAM-dependent methyltransferase